MMGYIDNQLIHKGKDMLSEKLENIVKTILEKPDLQVGLEKYRKLIHLLNVNKIDVSKDMDFQKLYKNFYAVAHRPVNFVPAYFNVFNKALNNPNIDKKDIFNRVCAIAGMCEISYVSKILHNLDQNIPIFDSVVGNEHFGFDFNKIRNTKASFEENRDKAWDFYLKYKKHFESYMKSDEAQAMVRLFDNTFPQYKNEISDVKKVDFVLWQDRTKKNKKTKQITQTQQIIIPDGYKYHKN